MLTKKDINIFRSEEHFFLRIENKQYDIFRAFDSLADLIKHLKQYPIRDLDLIIKELKRI